MKVTNSQLSRIIEQELDNLLEEQVSILDTILAENSDYLDLDIKSKMNELWKFLMNELTPTYLGKIGRRPEREKIIAAFNDRVTKIVNDKKQGGLYDRILNPKLKQGDWAAGRNQATHGEDPSTTQPMRGRSSTDSKWADDESGKFFEE